MQFEQQIIGAIKIKDGLFIGDEYSSKDLEFIVSNKVTHIINCGGKQVPNAFENFGVKYLTFTWVETDQQILFDNRDQNVNDIFNFIENAVSQGESTLVHSVRGQSRACCALAAFFMKKYKWKLYKTLEFLNSRRPDLEIRASFFHQLTQLEQKLLKSGQGAYSSSWDPSTEQDLKLEHDERLLRNTFQNSKQSPPAEYWLDRHLFQQCLRDRKDRKIIWADEGRKGKLIQVIGQNSGTQGTRSITPSKRVKSNGSNPKSILREVQNQPNVEKKEDFQQLAAAKIDNINGNIIHLTVNNYLTPQQQLNIQPNNIVIQQAPPKVNNFFEMSEQTKPQKVLENVVNSNHIPPRGAARRFDEEQKQTNQDELKPSQIPQNYRRQNDSLKKHLDDKKQQYQSPYAYTMNNQKPTQQQQPQLQPKQKVPLQQKEAYMTKAIPVIKNTNNDAQDRPSSAYVPKQQEQFQQPQKRPTTGFINTRQFSPVVKGMPQQLYNEQQGTNINRNQPLIVTNYNKQKTGLRYPSPGQQKIQEDLFNNSLLLGKPSWK